MNRPNKISLPTTLAVVVVATAAFTGPWIACDSGTSSGGSTSHGSSGGGSTASAGGKSTASGGGTTGPTLTTTDDNQFICIPGADAGPDQMCPDTVDAGDQCPPGCQIESV